MIPPKYKFYVGRACTNITFTANSSIDLNTGNTIQATDAHSSNKVKADGNAVFINLISNTGYNSICFYDSNYNYIGYEALLVNKTVISLPSGASYFALRFSDNDSNFMAAKDTQFIHTVSSVVPHYKELSKKYAKENGQEFFRTSIEGKIKVFGNDYKLINNFNIEGSLTFVITKQYNDSNTWLEYYKGTFSKTDCKFDHEKKSCEIKTTAIDQYTNILNKYENAYDLIKLTPEITRISLHKRSLMQVYIRGANSITNLFGGIYWESDINEAVDDFNELKSHYHFAYITSGNEFYISDSSIAEVNGVYAGTNGKWYNTKGYTCYADEISEIALGIKRYKIKIKRNSDNVVIYQVADATNNRENYDISISQEMELVNPNNSDDKCTIKSPFVYDVFQRLLCDIDSITDTDGTKNTYDLPSDDFVTDNRNYKKCIGLVGGIFICTAETTDEPTRYGINDYGKYFTSNFVPVETGISRLLPLSRNSWANASLWYSYNIFYKQFEVKLRKQYTLRDCYSIASTIKALLKQIDPSIKHEATSEYSRFLYDTSVPIPMHRFYVFITQKSNVLKGNYDQAAQKAEITFKNLMDMLSKCFRCYWYIEDNKFKIEHISFFMNGGSYSGVPSSQLDFTEIKDQFNKRPLSYFQSEIEYDKAELNHRYEFSWMDDVTSLFSGVSIDVNSNYVQQDKTEEISVNDFSSDIDYMLFNPNGFSSDGFALMCATKNGSSYELPIIETTLIDEDGNEYSAVAQNWYASWVYLLRFYMYDMPAWSISNGVIQDLYVRGIKKCVKHTIELPIEKELNLLKLIKTNIGDGKIEDISVNMNTNQAKIQLAYEPV